MAARLWVGQMPDLLVQSAALLAGTILALVVGIAAAWLVERTDLPARRLARVAALPLAIPGYVAAICYIILLRRGGGWNGWPWTWAVLPRRGAAASALQPGRRHPIIGLVSYPYIYLPTAAALRGGSLAGRSGAHVRPGAAVEDLPSVTLPLVLPAVAGGAPRRPLRALRFWHGGHAALSYLHHGHLQPVQRADRPLGRGHPQPGAGGAGAAAAFGEGWFSRRQRRLTADTAWRPRQLIQLGRWRWPALFVVTVVVMLALGFLLLVWAG